MKTTRLLNPFFLISVRKIVHDFLAFFRFTEADAGALLSAFGLNALELDRLLNNHPNEQKETSGSLGGGKPSHADRLASAPIPIGVHPNFTRANWTTLSRKHVYRFIPSGKWSRPRSGGYGGGGDGFRQRVGSSHQHSKRAVANSPSCKGARLNRSGGGTRT